MSDLDDLVDQWNLRPDGDVVTSAHARVLAVRSSEGAQCVLRISTTDDHAHLVLRHWNGAGAVRLLRADPHRRAVLLERLRPQTLATLDEPAACEVLAQLYRRLHVGMMPQLPSLTSLLGRWADEFAALPRSAAIPHRLVERAVTLCHELATEPANHVLHGNLHFDNVLAADREPWLAISPTPLNGNPHWELAPVLWNRWDALAGDVRGGIRYRLYTLVDAAGLDEDTARAWITVRVVHEAAEAMRRNDPADLTTYVTLAKAVQD